MSAQDRHNPPPAPSEREYEALIADAELGRKRGEWLTEAYARISELEVENRRLREENERLREERDTARQVADDGWAWVEKALAALGVKTVFDIPEKP